MRFVSPQNENQAVGRLGRIAAVPLLLVVMGTFGYVLIEGWGFFDALYMTVITLTTVGYLEVHELSEAGRVFTMVLAMGGVFTLFFSAGEVIGGVARGDFADYFGRLKMQRQLAQLDNHYIVCGYGRLGKRVCREFTEQKLPFVVIERDAEVLAAEPPQGVVIHGDATNDELLKEAGIERARCIVALAASDADNLFITVSSRLMNEKITIVARGESDQAERKLLRAGATRVVSPYAIGGHRMAQAVVRPTVVDFLELATEDARVDLSMEELEVCKGSKLIGKALKDSGIRQDFGVILVAVRKTNGEMVFNPDSNFTIEPGERLVALGPTEGLTGLAKKADGSA